MVSKEIEARLKDEILSLKEKTGKVPGLTVIIVGENPAAKIYVRTKERMATKLGINSHVLRLDKEVASQTLIDEIEKLNRDDDVDAVLVQLPLPGNLNTWEILDHLSPGKDVDRFHPLNLGMIILNRANIFPCTPFGILKILRRYKIDPAGMNAVVLGRSFIVGKPIAGMLTNKNATVTVCHSKTKDLKESLKNADLVVSAIGKPGIITADMVKEGAVLVDVGMNYLDKKADVLKYCDQEQIGRFAKKGYGITGDIHKDAFKKASYYTPVPGGVGPMTVTMLMYNSVQLFKQKNKI
jgi:methylenetetrahydrofolate dehydrogenase (NADP+)/methenyltetrahydrofolate cyclohydrolase